MYKLGKGLCEAGVGSADVAQACGSLTHCHALVAGGWMQHCFTDVLLAAVISCTELLSAASGILLEVCTYL